MKKRRITASAALENVRAKEFGNGGIKCKCLKCGGDGYAKDETCLDSNGFLLMPCPCGGKIQRVKRIPMI